MSVSAGNALDSISSLWIILIISVYMNTINNVMQSIYRNVSGIAYFKCQQPCNAGRNSIDPCECTADRFHSKLIPADWKYESCWLHWRSIETTLPPQVLSVAMHHKLLNKKRNHKRSRNLSSALVDNKMLPSEVHSKTREKKKQNKIAFERDMLGSHNEVRSFQLVRLWRIWTIVGWWRSSYTF